VGLPYLTIEWVGEPDYHPALPVISLKLDKSVFNTLIPNFCQLYEEILRSQYETIEFKTLQTNFTR